MSALALRSERLAALKAQMAMPNASHPVDLVRFADAFFAEVLPSELAQLTPTDLLRIADFAWDTTAHRPPGHAQIRIETIKLDDATAAARRTALCIVNDDMPFLVDSIGAELAARGLRVDVMLHPILDTGRARTGERTETIGPRTAGPIQAGAVRESIVYIELERIGARGRRELTDALHQILSQVRDCVTDWRPMRDRLRTIAEDLKARPAPVAPNELHEAQAFLDWLADDNFTFLGYRRYRFTDDAARGFDSDDALGLLRDADYPIWRGADGFVAFSPDLLAFLKAPEPLMITKTNARSPVHRRVHMDYVGVKFFDAEGRAIGEHRFVGLFTSSAYALSPREIPVLRRKVAKVVDLCNFDAKSHAGKALVHVLENFPRDEMIQMTADQLMTAALGVLSLLERPRPWAFIRRDSFERFVSVLTYVPRDAYRSDIREQVAAMLTSAFNARLSMYSVELRDDGLARVHFILGTMPGKVGQINDEEINRRLSTLVRGWDEQLERALIELAGPARAARLRLSHGNRFSASYRSQFSADDAALDIVRLAKLKTPADRAVGFYQRATDAPHQIRLKIYRLGEIIALSDCAPVLENLGLRVIEEFPFDLDNGALGWVHDFLLEDANRQPIDLDTCRARLEETLLAVFQGEIENDGFNALVLQTEMKAGHVVWLRAIFRYMRQVGWSFGADTVRAALMRYPVIAQDLVDLFITRFDPAADEHGRPAREAALLAKIEEGLQQVTSLEDDRTLRFYQTAMQATLRTNAFQTPAPDALAMKIKSQLVPGMPLPVPYVEIFVYSPRVEGIHLRGGPVARGGLRWSDRRDDFRTEILGLIKAQTVKNAVIVPVGAEGGFYPKQLPPASDREAWLAEGIASYKIFIRALLSLTDNLKEHVVVPPAGVVRHDHVDPYLVVAADKGTATFSDIANGLAQRAGFWLDDAFASGGSNGYDHKKMAITARGAWISVERHFREQGINVATDPVRVIGVGDMSGDVFGNGLLRSTAVKLVAAFDHRHIFLDPDPQAAASFAERQRMFDLPRSSWADYDASLLSAGGGIFPRTAKSIVVSAQIKAMLGVTADHLTPTELIHAILQMPADLLWLGGIGTYVKAASESHSDVGDKANDSCRVDAEMLRVKVVGEGANLGLTQKARIAFATNGGAINTDFIDNSAGVDCSDNEVNLKILLGAAISRGELASEARNALLVELTDAIGAIVLRDNYLQTQALSIAQAKAPTSLAAHGLLIRTLEQHHHMSRKVEGLPSDAELAERAKNGRCLTRPELAALLSHAKLALKTAILADPLADDAALQEDLTQAFPEAIQARFPEAIARHRLRREIAATKLSNQIVNRGGLTLAFDLAAATGQSLARVAAAFVAVRSCFEMRRLWRLIDSYDYKIPAALQTELYMRAASILRGQVMRLLSYEGDWSDVHALIARLKPSVDRLLAGPFGAAPIMGIWADLEARGAPADVVRLLTTLDAANDATPVAALVSRVAVQESDVLEAVRLVDQALSLDWLGAQMETLHATDPWDRLAIHTLASDLLEARFARANQFAQQGDIAPAAQDWLVARTHTAKRLGDVIMGMKSQPVVTLAMLTHAVALARLALA